MKKELSEEIKRIKQIQNHLCNLQEQVASPAPPAPPSLDTAPVEAPSPGITDPTAVASTPDTMATDVNALNTPQEPSIPDEDVEGLDVTDLVRMTKDVKKDIEDNKSEQTATMQKVDSLFTQIDMINSKLGVMDQLLGKIDELGQKVEASKPPTPVEKLEMRSLDSYPFNQKPNEFFAKKMNDMEESGKNEYVLRKGDIDSYDKGRISNSFNPVTYNS